MQESGKRNQKILAITGVLAIAVLVVLVALFTKKPETSKTIDTSTTTNSQPSDTETDNAAADFKDGVYTATGTYASPGGTESITITVTLEDDVIAKTSAKSGSTNSDSEEYQAQFIDVYSTKVVGKRIDTINLSRVSGSSLTSKGFNAALDAIKQQAQV